MNSSSMTLADKATYALSHLEKIGNVEFIESVLRVIDDTSVAHLRGLYELCLNFYTEHAKFPDTDYLEANSVDFLPTGAKFSADVIVDFIRELQKDSITLQAQEALAKGDQKTARDLLNSNSHTDVRKKFGVADVVGAYKKMTERPSGILTGIPEIDDLTKGLTYGTMTVMAGPPGSFKCVSKGTRVSTSEGYKKIEELCLHRIQDQAILFRTEVWPGEYCSHFYYGGLKRTLIIDNGIIRLGGTEVHPVRVWDDGLKWKKLGDLSPQDNLALSRKENILFSKPTLKPLGLENLNERDYGYFIGYLLGDGGVQKRRVYICGTRKNVDHFDNLIKGGKIYRDKRRDDLYSIYWNGVTFATHCLELGLGGNSKTKTLPEWVFESNREFLVGLLSGLIDSDGSIVDRSVSSNSKNLLLGVRDVFNLFGIYPTLSHYRDFYRLRFNSDDCTRLGFLELRFYKKKQLTELLGLPSKALVPLSSYVRELVLEAYSKLGSFTRSERRGTLKPGFSFVEKCRDKSRLKISSMGYSSFRTLCDLRGVDTTELDSIFEDWKIVPVGSLIVGSSEVFDLTVPDSHSFYANGVVNHNTTSAASIFYKACVLEEFNFVYWTLEVSKRDFWFSLFARHSHEMGNPLSAEKMKKALLSPEEEEFLQVVQDDLMANMKGKAEVISGADVPNFELSTLDNLWATFDEEMGGLDGIILDYVQLLKFYCPKFMSVEEFVNYAIRYFSQLAVNWKDERGLINILLSQVNRKGEAHIKRHNKGTLQVFAEFNELERSGHNGIVLFSTEADRLSNQCGTSLVKNRTGPTREEFAKSYVDPEHFIVGSEDFEGLFTSESMDLLGTEDDIDDGLFT